MSEADENTGRGRDWQGEFCGPGAGQIHPEEPESAAGIAVDNEGALLSFCPFVLILFWLPSSMVEQLTLNQ